MAKIPQRGRARAKMVLGPLAETKGPRRAGTKPRKYLFIKQPLQQLLPHLLRRLPQFLSCFSELLQALGGYLENDSRGKGSPG